MLTSECDKAIDSSFPLAFQAGLIRCAFTARQLAWEDTQKFARPEAENARPWVARAFMEGLLRDLATQHSELSASVVRASNWNHTEVRGGQLVLTQNSVATPCALIDYSDFRGELARDNSNVPLWGDPEPDSTEFLVVLLHSQFRSIDRDEQQRSGHLAGSVYLAVPAADQKGYLHTINLVQRFPEVVRSLLPRDWTNGAVLSFIQRSRRVVA